MNSIRLFTVGEGYKHLVLLFRTVRYVSKARKHNLLDKQFMERIMLGVTQVNGCLLCSYAHAKMALELGMGEKQIRELLDGELGNVPLEQLKAVLFAQNYAEMRGRPSKAAWDEIVHIYGEDTAKGILGAIRIMLVGNIWGIGIGFLKDRILNHTVDSRSSVGYELLLILTIVPLLPVASIHALVLAILGAPLLTFTKEKEA